MIEQFTDQSTTCGEANVAASPLNSLVAKVLGELTSIADENSGTAIEGIAVLLQQELGARSAAMFFIQKDLAAVRVAKTACEQTSQMDMPPRQSISAQSGTQDAPDPKGPANPRIIRAKAPDCSFTMVFTYAPSDSAPKSNLLPPDVKLILLAIGNTLRRTQMELAKPRQTTDDITNALDQCLATFGPAGQLQQFNAAFQKVFSNQMALVGNLKSTIDYFQTLTTRGSLSEQAKVEMFEQGGALQISLPGKRVWDVKIRRILNGQTLLNLTDITEIYGEKTRLAAAIDGAGIGTWEFLIAEDTSHFSPRWAEMLGYSHAELNTLNWSELRVLLTPEARAANRLAIERILDGKTDRYDCELQMYHKNGHRIWVLSRGRVTAFDAEGKPTALSGMHLEITAFKMAEERLKQVSEGAQIGTWDWDIAAEIQASNAQWATILGYTEQEMSPMTYDRWRGLVHPDDISRVEADMSLCLDGQQDMIATEYRMRHKNGGWRWMIDRAKVISKTRDGKAAYIAGVQIEISEQKAREEALNAAKTIAEQALNERNRAEQRLADIAAVSDDWFWEQDSDLRFQFFSHTHFLDNVSGAKAVLLGRSWSEWLTDSAPEQSGANWASLFQTLTAKQPFRDFVMQLNSDTETEPRWLRFSGTPVFDELGHFIGYRGVGSDVTQLYLAKLRAEDANQSKSMFLANMSHEIRTPLNGVLGMAEVLESSLTEPRQKEMIKTIRDSGASLLNILNDILDMSKIEARKMVLEAVPFDPTELAMGIEDLHRLRAEEKGLEFEISLGIGAGRLRIGDHHRLRQILNNLVSNAIKFTERGSVKVVIRGKPNTPLVIDITDTGIGMSQDQIEHIDEEFVQADASITRRYGGTGLGMSITRTLIDMMGGKMSITSELRVGTRVVVELPLANSEAAPDVVAMSEVKPGAGQGLNCLIADDNATNCTVLRHLLRQLGADTTVVVNGLQAFESWQINDFDLLLLDIAMPIMDGRTAIEKIRAEEKTTGRSYTPAIAVTANVMPYQIAEYIEAGFDAAIGKPLSSKQLAQTIASLLTQSMAVKPANRDDLLSLPS